MIGVANMPMGLMKRVRLTPDESHTTISESSIPARQHEQDRHEQSGDEHDGEIADHGRGRSGPRRRAGRSRLDAAKPTMRIIIVGQHERKQHHEHGTSRIREFALEGAFEDHY